MSPVTDVSIQPSSEQFELARAAMFGESTVHITHQRAFFVRPALPERRAETIAFRRGPRLQLAINTLRNALDVRRCDAIRIDALIRREKAVDGNADGFTRQPPQFGANPFQQIIHGNTVGSGSAPPFRDTQDATPSVGRALTILT